MSGCLSVSSNASTVSITVTVPVYNAKKYLHECLDSIFSQDYRFFNVVMVDDGSTDGSGAICDGYARRYSQRATVIHKDNEGPLLARCEGFNHSSGEYVMCVDADDVLYPGAIAAVASAIEFTQADIVHFRASRKEFEIAPVEGDLIFDYYGEEEKSTMLRTLCCAAGGSANSMCFKAIRRECSGFDIDFSAFRGLTFAEDFLHTLAVYDRAQTICNLNAVLYFYRPASGGTRSYRSNYYRDACCCLDIAENYARRWERDYGCHGLLAGLAACRLDAAAKYAEWLAAHNDASGLAALRTSSDFVRCAKTAGSQRHLRCDRRFSVWAISHGIVAPLRLLSWIRTQKRRLFK